MIYVSGRDVTERLEVERTVAASEQRFRSLADLGAAFGFQVVGEGVETAEQLEVLAAAGCDLAQGFLIARPCAPASLVDRLRAGRVDITRLVH